MQLARITMQNTSEYIVFDIETQKSFDEIGGRYNLPKMGLSVAVVYDSRTGETSAFREHDVDKLVHVLETAPKIVGFNILQFDYRVLQGYSDFAFNSLPTVDLMQHVVNALGFRLSLDNLAQATLKAGKSSSGLQAIEWYRQGEWEKLIAYCRDDVLITRDLYEFGKMNGHVVYYDRKFRTQKKLKVQW